MCRDGCGVGYVLHIAQVLDHHLGSLVTSPPSRRLASFDLAGFNLNELGLDGLERLRF